MQSQRVNEDEVSPLSQRLVGARGANAAKRAARAVHLAAVSDADQADSKRDQATEMPAARRTEAPDRDDATVASPCPPQAAEAGSNRPRGGARARRRRLVRLPLVHGRPLSSSPPTTPMSTPTPRRSPPRFPAMSRAIAVADNAYVHAGDVIARIDDGDYRLAVDTARDKLATQQATVARIGKQIEAQKATVAQAEAQLASARAVETRNAVRIGASAGFGGKAVRQPADARTGAVQPRPGDRRPCKARRPRSMPPAPMSTCSWRSSRRPRRQAQELKTALAKAERDLSFTVIRAPIDGVIGNRAMQVGDYAQTGQRLASLVPLDGRLYRRQFQGDAARAPQARPAGRHQRRRAAEPRHHRHRDERIAGFRFGVLAAAARQRDRQFHQDRAAAHGAHPPARRCDRPASAAARHVGRGRRRTPSRMPRSPKTTRWIANGDATPHWQSAGR